MTTFSIAYESYLSTGDGQLVPITVVYDVKYVAQYVESNVKKNTVMNMWASTIVMLIKIGSELMNQSTRRY
jgi:hypothetical protein